MSAELPNVLTYPEDGSANRAILESKRIEYAARLQKEGIQYIAPELKGNYSNWYAYTILERLATTGSVDYNALAEEFAAYVGDSFNPQRYASRFSVIADYVLTGGENVRGGTGIRDGAEGEWDPNTDINIIACRKAIENGEFDHMSPGTFVAYIDGKYMGHAPTREALLDIPEIKDRPPTSEIYRTQVNVPDHEGFVESPLSFDRE